jgi:plasmid maintenance system killer protein
MPSHSSTNSLSQVLPSSNRLEALKGDRKGQWSIRINDQWRICFEWRDGNAEQIEIVDYHRDRLTLFNQERAGALR